MAVPSPTYLLQNIYDDLEGESFPARSIDTSGEAVQLIAYNAVQGCPYITWTCIESQQWSS